MYWVSTCVVSTFPVPGRASPEDLSDDELAQEIQEPEPGFLECRPPPVSEREVCRIA